MNRDKQDQIIEGYVEFVNADLSGVKDIREQRFWINKIYNLEIDLSPEVPSWEDAGENKWLALKDYQIEWRSLLDWIMGHLDQDWGIEYEVKETISWVGGTFEQGTYFGAMSAQKARAEHYITPSEYTELILPRGWQLFAAALNDLPSTALARCARCNKIFYNPTARRKTYCSTTCQAGAAVTRSRRTRKELH